MFVHARVMLPVVLLAVLPSVLPGAEPVIRTIDIRGVRIGGATIITIDGDDFGKAPRLLLPFAAKQVLKSATDKKAVFEVHTLQGDVEPGYYQLRLYSEAGVSLPVIIGVDALPQLSFGPAASALPIALHGTVAGSGIVETSFKGKAKERVMIEVEAQRLGAKLRPVVHFYNARKLQLAWSWGTPALFGDTRLEAVLPEDGTYTVTLHDAEYAAPAPSFFRLKIGQWNYVDQVFPPVVAKDQLGTHSLVGGSMVHQVTLKAPANADILSVSWPTKNRDIWSGPRPFVSVSSHAEYVEQATSGTPQEIPAGTAGVSGKLATPMEEDRYRIAVTPGKKMRLEVFAERLGSPLDCALVVRNEQGIPLARAEDSPGTLDPVLEYTVPDKVTSVIVGVVDAQGRGGPRGMYRLLIEPQGATKDAFKLTTTAQRISLPLGGATLIPVQVDRKAGYRGPIELTCEPKLPALELKGATIPADADGTLVSVARLEMSFDPVIVTFRGKAAGSERPVYIKNHPLERLQPWLATELVVGRTSANAKDFAVDWRDLSDNTVIVPASRMLLPVKLTRPADKNTVKLTLLTSQNTPILNNQPDPNKALRQDKVGDLAAKVNTGDVTMLAPPELSAPVYDVSVQAELLDPAKKVLATAYTPVRRMAVVLPIAVKLDGPDRIETIFDAKKGAIIKLQGKLERRAGLKADVAIGFAGLPAGAKADAVTVKADAAVFTVNVTFPPTVAAGEYSGIKISGSFAPDAKQPNVRVKSREVDVTLVLKAGK